MSGPVKRRMTCPRTFALSNQILQLVAIFGEHNVFVELQRHYDRDEEVSQSGRHRNRAQTETAAARHQRRLARNRSRIAICSTPSPACITRPPFMKPAACSPATPSATSSTPRRWRNFSPIVPEAIANTHNLAARLGFTLRDLGYKFPEYPVPPGETMNSYLRQLADAGARERYRPVLRKSPASDRARARDDRKARSGRLFPDRLGHCALLHASKDCWCRDAARPPTAPCVTR